MESGEPRLHEPFHNLYVANGVARLTNGQHHGVLLHEHCPDRCGCWGSRLSSAGEATWNEICLPHIGPKCGVGAPRVVVLGLNYYRWGGYRLSVETLPWVGAELRSGKKKVTKTLYWHRFACYVSLMLWTDWRIEDASVFHSDINLLDDTERLGQAFERIAYIESVKCSPPWKNSQPTKMMHLACPERFLRPEFALLAPDIVVRLGVHTPTGLESGDVTRDLLDHPFRCTQIRMIWGEPLVVTVPHPTAHGGNKRAFVPRLARLLHRFRDVRANV